MMRFRKVAAVAALLFACTAVQSQPAPAQPRKGGTVTSFNSGYRTLNPAVQSGAATGLLGSQIFAGLVLIGDNYEPKPYLASSWEAAKDGLSYTFHLVEGATFHDGTPITSADVAYSLRVVRENHPFGKSMFGSVADVETPNPQTAVFRLSAPVPGLLLSMQPLLLPIMPKHIYDDGQQIRSHPRNMQDVVGSGPFRVTENNPTQRLVLERYDGFFIKGRPLLDKIIVNVVADPLTRVLMLERGDIEYAGFAAIGVTGIQRLATAKNLTLSTKGYEAIGYIHSLEMNLRRKPFDDLRVRRALAHALDTNFIANVLFAGRPKPITGPLHWGNPFYTADVPYLKFDMSRAAALLDEAGLKAGADGQRFGFTLDVPAWAIQSHGPMAEYIRSQLAKLGIKVELRRTPDFGTWVKRISSFDYDATMNGTFNYPDPVIGVHRHFLCNNIRNVIWSNTQGYCNPEMDRILNAAAVETNKEKRLALYHEFQRLAVSDQVFIWMPEELNVTVVNNKIGGAPAGPYGPLAPWLDLHVRN
jgi:peptide/nickel transport system substrate-binding protein